MKPLDALKVSGREVLPLIEGGKGINISTGISAGAWAAAGGVGTFSGVNADTYDDQGNVVPMIYKGKTRKERHEELVNFGILGGIEQARIAHETAGGQGRLHINVLWEMGGAERILHGVLEKCRDLIHGITCGAGMPYRLGEIAAKYGVHYYPIVSSARAFRALWKRAYGKYQEMLGGVVYEDPWLAGGHNGLSNSEDPRRPEPPLPRVIELRRMMRENNCPEIPIIMAGGVWRLDEWQDFIDNPDVGPICFQFGTRPLLTRESPISDDWKQRLLTLKDGDVLLHQFSPTGFYSSAVENDFLSDLVARSDRQVAFRDLPAEGFEEPFEYQARKKPVHVGRDDLRRIATWQDDGHIVALKTPEETLVFVTPEKAAEIKKDQQDCMGCLSACQFSSWAENETGMLGRRADPRSFCIQKTLQNIGHGGDVENELMFSGHNAYRFATDPFYSNGFIPTVRQLVDRLVTGQ